MKIYTGTFILNENIYTDTIEEYWYWMAKIELKIRNTAKLIKIETKIK